MSKSILAFLAIMLLSALPALPVAAQDFPKTILTGGPTGTYIKFGRDIAAIAETCDLTLDVEESAGSLENFLGVRQRANTQFGIVQSDVLEYLRTYAADDPDIARAIAGVRIAFPLYNEEVHLLARSEIASLADLAGRRVAVGVEDSGTFLTASLALDLMELDVERLTIPPDASLDQLMAGEIDAMFYVAGAPTALFDDERIDPEAFHLVAMTDDVLRAVYQPATIPAGTYGFQSEAVDVVAVKAVLMTYDYDPARNAYHRQSCQAVTDISHLILSRFEQLRANGHSKWTEVDLEDIPPGWEVAGCVNAGLDPDYRLACAGAPAEPVAESGANSVYRERICASIGC